MQDFIPGLLVGALAATILCFVGFSTRESAFKQEAVKKGYATWFVHPDGGTTFTWK
jgi:hypothetical protein